MKTRMIWFTSTLLLVFVVLALLAYYLQSRNLELAGGSGTQLPDPAPQKIPQSPCSQDLTEALSQKTCDLQLEFFKNHLGQCQGKFTAAEAKPFEGTYEEAILGISDCFFANKNIIRSIAVLQEAKTYLKEVNFGGVSCSGATTLEAKIEALARPANSLCFASMTDIVSELNPAKGPIQEWSKQLQKFMKPSSEPLFVGPMSSEICPYPLDVGAKVLKKISESAGALKLVDSESNGFDEWGLVFAKKDSMEGLFALVFDELDENNRKCVVLKSIFYTPAMETEP